MRNLYALLLAAICFSANAQTNNALTFNGTSTVVNIGTPFTAGSAYTKEAWVYLTSAAGPRNIVSSNDIPLWVDAGVLKAGDRDNYGIVSDATMPLNRWTHVAVTFGGGVMRLYRDGVLRSTSSGAVLAVAPQATFIGSHQGSAAFWQGAIDEVRIWNIALSQTQIRANMVKGPANNAANLIDYYKFNEGSGTTLTNSSTNGIGSNGTITAGSWSASPVSFAANALSLDGANDYVDIGSGSTLKPTTALTHEVWIKAANFAVSGTQQVTSNFENGGYGIGLVSNTIQWELRASSSASYQVVTYPASNLTNNQWYHIAGTFDGSYMRLYVNGVEVNSLSLGGTGRTIVYNNPGNSMLIGAEASAGSAPVAGYYYNGQVDEVRIWNVARTPAQILSTYNTELDISNASATNGLVGYYTFNQGNTNGLNPALETAHDLAGMNNGTLYNFALTGTSSNYVTPPVSLIVLPVQLKSFTARIKDNKTALQWTTAREVNALSFGIQHSTNGVSFENIGTVSASGNSTSDKTYDFIHNIPSDGANYYRLAQKDIDGKINYSEIRKIEFVRTSKQFTLHNTVVGGGPLRFTNNKPLVISVFTATGKLVMKKQFTAGTHDIGMNQYAKGMYWISTPGTIEKVIVQ